MGIDAQALPIFWALTLPLLGALGVQALGRWQNLRDAWTVVVGVLTFGAVTRLIDPVMAGARPSLEAPNWMPGLGL
jgi:hypothetical protein